MNIYCRCQLYFNRVLVTPTILLVRGIAVERRILPRMRHHKDHVAMNWHLASSPLIECIEYLLNISVISRQILQYENIALVSLSLIAMLVLPERPRHGWWYICKGTTTMSPAPGVLFPQGVASKWWKKQQQRESKTIFFNIEQGRAKIRSRRLLGEARPALCREVYW